MSKFVIDSHIHFDLYSEEERQEILDTMEINHIAGLITVSKHLKSCKYNLALSLEHPNIYPAFGYHPEQPLPTDEELENLIQFIEKYHEKIVAIGEVGLPYYLRKEKADFPLEPYIEILEEFIILSKNLHKPIILHAIYEDAPVVLGLLEKHSIKKAHFHWFKGESRTQEQMAENGYFISITPDIAYKDRTRKLVNDYPLDLMMVETDGPWSFDGPFLNQMTHPKMIHESIKQIAEIKGVSINEVYRKMFDNTRAFYEIKR